MKTTTIRVKDFADGKWYYMLINQILLDQIEDLAEQGKTDLVLDKNGVKEE